MTTDEFTDDDWRMLLELILRHVSHGRFQQWDMFSLPLSGTTNRLYVQWGMRPPEGDQYAHHYPLLDPRTGKADPDEASR